MTTVIAWFFKPSEIFPSFFLLVTTQSKFPPPGETETVSSQRLKFFLQDVIKAESFYTFTFTEGELSVEPNPGREIKIPLQRLHERPKKYLGEWLDFPAHVHHTAFRMKNPPFERPESRQQFLHVLKALEIEEANCNVMEKFGFGVRIEENGDRLVIVWEAHTEYYSYQIWHIPDDKNLLFDFGPISLPGFEFPVSPLGDRVTSLDIIFSQEPKIKPDLIRGLLPGPHVYGSQVFGEEISIVTSFTPDEHMRERYLIFSASPKALLQLLPQVIDAVATMENYYHLLLLPFPEFSKAVDRIHQLEQHHLEQRTSITAELSTSDSKTLQGWVNQLTQDFLEVSRFAEAMRYQLSASVPYNTIVISTIRALQEKHHPPFLPLSDYVLGGISGVADGYGQLIRRIEAVESDFQGSISVIRTRVSLMQQEQNLVLEDQNLKLLSNVDKTTKSQAVLQQTVEGLSVIVIAYYLSGLANHVFKAMEGMGWIASATIATGLFVPISIGFSIALIYFGRKFIYKKMWPMGKI